VAVAEEPSVTLLGETEHVSPVGSWNTTVPRLTVPEKPFTLVTVTVELVWEPTSVVMDTGLTAMVKSKNVTCVWPLEYEGAVAVTVNIPGEADLMVILHDPVELVVQLVADKTPPVDEKDTVTLWALVESCAMRVDVVEKSAGTEVGLADSVIAAKVTVVVAEE